MAGLNFINPFPVSRFGLALIGRIYTALEEMTAYTCQIALPASETISIAGLKLTGGQSGIADDPVIFAQDARKVGKGFGNRF